MADKDFVVKNGLQVNGGTWVVNASGVYYSGTQLANNSYFFQSNTTLTANNATNLGGVAAAAYVNTSGNYTLSGNIVFNGNLNITSTNTVFGSGFKVGANVIGNTSALFIGNTSVNAIVNSTGLFVNGSPYGLDTVGGYYKGNAGAVGNTANKGNLYRINSNTQSNNVTIVAGENALTVGPMVIDTGYNLTIEEGGRAVII